MLVLLTLSIFAFDSEIDSVTIVGTPVKEVTINGSTFQSGSTYVLEFMSTEDKEALQSAVNNHNKLIKSVTFKKNDEEKYCYSLTGAWIGDTPYCEAHKPNWVR